LRNAWNATPKLKQAAELRADPSLRWRWELWARDAQLPPPGDWTNWLILAGRGFGKTRTGAEWVREAVKTSPHTNLIGPTADDARDIMIEGESGILAACPKRERPVYMPSKRRLNWPNGAKSLIFTADEPERLRGKQHSALWMDELASWRYTEAFDQAMFGLRLGTPRCCITTTPKPSKIIRDLMADSATVLTRGSTYQNRANLANAFFASIIKAYEGTRIGRQELNAEVLDDNPRALWSRKAIDALRLRAAPLLRRVVVAIDPSVTSNENSDEAGIIVAGVGFDDHLYVLADYSVIGTPQEWATAAVQAYHFWQADRIIAETNNGGDLVEAVLRMVDPLIPYRKVTATRGKVIRAEPIAALYEQGRAHHCGSFDRLEDQMVEFDPTINGPSPDRMDALVWAGTDLMLGGNAELVFGTA
jgi:phage terminase large subunit-like protein